METLCDFLPSILLIYRQAELNVWLCSHYCSVLDSILLWVFSPLILRLFSHCTNHSNYTYVICHLVHIKSSSAAFQTLMWDMWFWTHCSKETSFLTRKVEFPAVFVSFMQHQANLKKMIIHLTPVICFSYSYGCEGDGSRSWLCSACNRLGKRTILVIHRTTSISISLQNHVDSCSRAVNLNQERFSLGCNCGNTLACGSLVSHCLVLDRSSNCFMDCCIANCSLVWKTFVEILLCSSSFYW